jgi:hypothetical protein
VAAALAEPIGKPVRLYSTRRIPHRPLSNPNEAWSRYR